MQFAERMAGLNAEQWLHFYEVLAHNLTVAIRGVWSDGSLSDGEKVERMKGINEVLHQATAKVYALRLRTHEWTEEDFGSLLQCYIDQHPGIKAEVLGAVNRSYRAVTGEDMG